MDPLLQVQIDHLEAKFREIEPLTGLHPEARALCGEALNTLLPRLREQGLDGGSQQAVEMLLGVWQTYHVVASRINHAEKVRRVMDTAFSSAANFFLSKAPLSRSAA